MIKTIIKRAGLIVFALIFAGMPLLNVSAANEETGNMLWGVPDDEGFDENRVYCGESYASRFPNICGGATSGLEATGAPSAERYIDITMHVNPGEGHFEEGDAQTHTVTYFHNDPFSDYTQPISERSNYVFAGWSTDPEATEANVAIGEMRASSIGTDVYAVWSDKAYVYYHIYNGAWKSADDEVYQQVLMEYDVGTNFQPLSPDPYPIQNVYDFVGWNTKAYSRGEPYTTSTVINQYITDVYSDWRYNASLIEDELELDVKTDVTVGVSIPVYKFTPEETAVYEIYTEGIESGEDEAIQAMIRLQDIYDRTLKIEQSVDPSEGWGDVHLYYEMQAGETYYVRFLEGGGQFLNFKASVRKPELVTVTFDSNHGEDAWFDGDHTKATKEFEIPYGDDVANYRADGLEYDIDAMSFVGWSFNDGHNYAVITEPATVYASYIELVAIPLDYNGGYNPFDVTETAKTVRFRPFDPFDSPLDPKIDDPHLKFAGWSRDPNATEPDTDFIEAKDTAAFVAELLNGGTLYAVYDEKVSVTFRTHDGAYMLDDPGMTVYEDSLAEGHIFYGMAAMHDHPLVVHTGWTDQNGVYIPETSEAYGLYHVHGDTTYDAVLKYDLFAYGNGGYFPSGGIGGYTMRDFLVPYHGWQSTFSLEDALKELGNPVSYEEGKHFVGFATEEDATEPDVIDGETPLEELGVLYAVWADDEPEEDDPIDDGGDDEEIDDDSPAVPDTGINTGQTDSGAVNYVVLPIISVIILLTYGLWCCIIVLVK